MKPARSMLTHFWRNFEEIQMSKRASPVMLPGSKFGREIWARAVRAKCSLADLTTLRWLYHARMARRAKHLRCSLRREAIERTTSWIKMAENVYLVDGRCTSTILRILVITLCSRSRCGAREAMTVGCKPTII